MRMKATEQSGDHFLTFRSLFELHNGIVNRLIKYVDRIITIILTPATLTLAFRGHDEHVHDDICEGGNFLGMVCMMAQYDKILAKVISLPARAL